MKKMSFLISLTVLAALLLAACGGGSVTEGTPGVETTDLVLPTTEAGLGQTPTVGTEAGDDLAGTPTGEVDLTPTVGTGAGGDLTETPSLAETATPQAGTGSEMEEGQFVLLSDLISMPVNAQGGEQAGVVSGVVVNGMLVPVTGSDESGTGDLSATGTPEATSEAGSDSGSGTDSDLGVAGVVSAPQITYLIIDRAGVSGTMDSDTDSSDSSASATATPDSNSSGTGSDTGSGSTSVVGGDEILVPFAAVQTDAFASGQASGTTSQALTLDLDSAAITSAPVFDSTIESGMATGGWDDDVIAYWSGEGMTIPATGAGTDFEGGSRVLRMPLDVMSVTGSAGDDFGQVRDFVVDLETGEIRYAVLAPISQQGQFFLVPSSHFNWGGAQSGAAGVQAGGLGSTTLNIPSASFNDAPSFSSLDAVDLSNLNEVDTYWETSGK